MKSVNHLVLTPGSLSLAQLREISRHKLTLELAPEAITDINTSAQIVQKVLDEGRTVYGINTGFGLLANTKIAPEDLQLLQRSIVLSHAAGTGQYMQDATVRLMMVLKINSLSRGFSGIRLEVINFLIRLVNAQVYPCVPEKGSVGASGDLAPLAHMCLPMLGEGEMSYQGELISAAEGLAIAGLKPIDLAAKEGLALLNGTQASTALALEGLFHAEDLFAASSVIGAMSVEAAMGSRSPFDPRIHAARGQKGQIDSAMVFRHLLGEESEISISHANCEKVQDPYSLRCQPQVLGACLTQIRHAADVLGTEANGVTDNPLVFQDTGDIISGGNFHAEPVAMAADNLAIAIAELGSIAERRIALLIDSSLSKLPPFLVKNGGVNSGFMIAQVTAAALASENKTYAHPASVDSLPTSANQEDHVSMATFAARRLRDMSENTRGVLAIEWLAAAQGLDFRAPLAPSSAVAKAKAELREVVAYYDKDRYFAPDIEAAIDLLYCASFNLYLPAGTLPSV
ncbi:histidine ammonia-lyase [Shewanella glacialipiscicola]|uniref:Histidine ammonia-lyase n=1 Tax=Shewanella glacialipiscicola TaxID=614069 RepID=A0ABQ6J6Z5_9GAMM|nr:histidine ammonia-lyase [Shewanella glacialipiscicola]MCL1087198.1 histidine ammonia-lyase [Shewanella glacialipiscicola]GIU15409.1 histidine ammonia-lyase [Shewanella glacialipiscicola]GMA83908.1 histidine ammonia-lyase [Shewanella glacialipiscicola]